MNGVNLIPASRLHAASMRSRIRTWAVLLGCTTLLCLPASLAVRIAWSAENADVLTQTAAIRATIEQLNRDIIATRKEIVIKAREELAARMVGEHPDWSVLLRAINHARGDRVALEDLRLSFTPAAATPAPGQPPAAAPAPGEHYTLVLRGLATDLPNVVKFVAGLEGIGALSKVTMKETHAQAVRGVTVTGFTVECALMERPVGAAAPPPQAASADATPREDRP